MDNVLLIRPIPIDITKGRDVELVVWTENGKEIKPLSLAHVMAKKIRDETTSERLEEMLEPFREKIDLVQKQYSKRREVLQVYGNREDLAAIHKEHKAHFDTISVPMWIRWETNFPYSIMSFNGDGMWTTRKAPLNILMGLADGALDIETNKKITKEEDLDDPELKYKEINTAIHVQESDGKYLADIFTTLTAGRAHEVLKSLEQLIEKKFSPLLDRPVDVRFHGCENWEDIPANLSAHMQISPAVTLHGHNLMAADLLWLRDMPDEEEFAPAIDESEPKITAHAGFGKRVEVKGYWVFDHYGFSRFYEPFLPDQKAETVSNFFDVPHMKSIGDYRTLGLKIWKAQNGSVEDAVEVLHYALLDTIASFQLGKKLKKAGIVISGAFETSLESICAVSPKMLGKNFWDKRTYQNTNSFDFIIPSLNFRNFKVLEEKQKLLRLPWENIPIGFVNDREMYAVYCNILPETFTLLKSDKTAKELLKALEDANGMEKYPYLRALDALCEVPFYQFSQTKVGKPFMGQTKTFYEMPDYVFGAKYKLTPNEAYMRLTSSISRITQVLKHMPVVNFTGELLIIEGEDLYSRLSGLKELIPLGKIDSIYNQEPGVFVANLGGKLISQGIDLRSKGKVIKKEKELIRGFYEILLMQNNPAGALDYIRNSLITPLNQGTISKEDLLIKIKLGKDVTDYSEAAQGGFAVYCGDKFKLKKGLEYHVGFGLDEKNRPEIYLQKDFMKSEIPIDIPKYKEWILEKGKIGTIIETVFNSRNEDNRRRALKHLFNNEASPSEIASLSKAPPPYVNKYRQQQLF